MRLLIVLAVLSAASLSAQAQGASGRADCAGCHEQAASFAESAHGKSMMARSPDLVEAACSNCHGSGSEHVENPSRENIRRLPDDRACLTCHSGARQELSRHSPGHDRNHVSCLDCHDAGHGKPDAPWLLRAKPTDLCGSCHGSQEASGFLPYAHRDGNLPFACTTCHSPHGTRIIGRSAILGSAGPCIECHGEKAGPFVYEHPPGTIRGCSSCHQAHGSPNPRLLTRRMVWALCLECHAGVPGSHDLSSERTRMCTACHGAIHGSNIDRRLFDE